MHNQYRIDPERRRVRSITWYKNNRAKSLARMRERYHTNSEFRQRSIARSGERQRTPEAKAQRIEWQRQKRQVDSSFRLYHNLCHRVNAALHGRGKSARTRALLGIESVEQYKTYLEQQFQPGMTWENYGTAWHVDHRIPLSTLDLSDETNQRFLFSHKNTRPMWAKANLSRGNRLQFEDLL